VVSWHDNRLSITRCFELDRQHLAERFVSELLSPGSGSVAMHLQGETFYPCTIDSTGVGYVFANIPGMVDARASGDMFVGLFGNSYQEVVPIEVIYLN
jgi:hypothetical protein